MTYDIKQIGKRIKKSRKEMKLTQSEFVEKFGLSKDSRQTVSKWETGAQVPSMVDLIKMGEMFDCESGYLLGEFDCKTKEDSDILKATGLSHKASRVLNRLNYTGKCRTGKNETSAFMNLVIENEEFWKEFMDCFGRYCREKPKSKNHIECAYQSYEVKELEVIRYSMTRMFDKMVDDLYKTIYIPRVKKLFDPSKIAKKNDGATKSAPSSE